MRLLFDMVHPAHVHFYRHLINRLQERGDDVLIASRPKDVTTKLLDGLDLPHITIGAGPRRGRWGQARELVARNVSLAKLAARFRPDIICTRNPAGAQIGRLWPGAMSIFDTDDGPAAGVHYRAAASFASIITVPDCLQGVSGSRIRRYPSYKALAYLHPEVFRPDISVLDELGVEEGEPYFLVRFVAMEASHDHGESGLSHQARQQLVDFLSHHGKVFVSGERDLPPELRRHQLPVAAHRAHDVLAFAAGYVGDSQTVAAEAAILGVPTIHCSSWSRRLDYLVEQEDRFQLLQSFKPAQVEEMFGAVDTLLTRLPDARATARANQRDMLDHKVNLSQWYEDLIDEYRA